MPYIKPHRRAEIRRNQAPVNAGELNFYISDIIDDYLLDKLNNKNPHHKYQDLNEVMGVLASVQAEFYRRVVVPFETVKEKENGEVFFSAMEKYR